MSIYLLDTDTLSLYYHEDKGVVSRLDSRSATELAISIVTVEEQLTGWYTLLKQARHPREIAHAYDRLGQAVFRLARWRILPYSEPAIARVAYLKTLKLNVGIMDLRIAAIALENDAVVVTRNRRDFVRIPGIRMEDWCL
ncbi:type II toxin-antitoxin system VapC family toxin [Aquisphaera insulae]|uniref:type II toxin-antitoxin system VapC family toxin n=1 Tax=Aquisphaera insulae TaxID=2712864 RepID=UPI0013EC37BC|nr:type II toxin-antitoxin system VapC family toxin [Aquisphaera insulae]